MERVASLYSRSDGSQRSDRARRSMFGYRLQSLASHRGHGWRALRMRARESGPVIVHVLLPGLQPMEVLQVRRAHDDDVLRL